MNASNQVPPLLPDGQWSASYVSYWVPMQPADEMTSGCVWFDYNRQIFRIDGLFNPWDETSTGYRLWMSEINFFGRGVTRKIQVPFVRGEAPAGFEPGAVVARQEVSQGCVVPRDVLRVNRAEKVEGKRIMGVPAEGWSFLRPDGRGPVTLYFQEGTRRLLRMVTGDPSLHALIRDFPVFSETPFPEDVFRIPRELL